jgi:hypothetical protein
MNANTMFYVGLDLGQSQDPAAIAVVERLAPGRGGSCSILVRHLERAALGTPYPRIVARVWAILNHIPKRDLIAGMPGAHHGKMRGCRPILMQQFRGLTARALIRQRFRRRSNETGGLLRSQIQNSGLGARETGSRELPQHPVAACARQKDPSADQRLHGGEAVIRIAV